MTLPAIRTAIVTALSSAGLGDAVEAHPGRLTPEDLKTFVVKGRAAIRVGCLGVPKAEKTGYGVNLQTSWAAYVIALDTAGTGRDETAMTLAAAICQLVAGNVWSRADIDSPDAIRADNLYSGTLGRRAIALWAVTWRQAWTPEPVSAALLDDLLSVVAAWDVDGGQDGEPQPIDTIELEGGTP